MPTFPQGQLPGLHVLQAHALPVEEVAEPLRPVPLVDALALAHRREVEHQVRQLVHRLVHALHAAVDDVDAVLLRRRHELLHVAAEAREVGADAGHAHDGALGRGVAPRLVVRREDAEVGAAHEVVVVHRQHRVGRAQELGVEDHLDAVARVVEELDAPQLVEDGVLRVVDHVVRHDGRQAVALHREEAAPQHDAVLAADDLALVREAVVLLPAQGALEQALADAALDHVDRVAQALDHGLALERLDRHRVRLGRHDDEGDDGHLGAGLLEAVVQPRERLDEHVDPLVPVLVPAGGEEVERVLGLEVDVAVEVAAHEVVDLLLLLLVQVLELVRRRELDDVETVGQHAVGLALQQVLALVRGDVRDGGEDVGRVGRGALDAVPVVDAALARLAVDVEVLEVVVEVDRAGAEVSAQQGRVRREDGRDVHPARLDQGKGDGSEPLVEVSDDGSVVLVREVLSGLVSVTGRGCERSGEPATGPDAAREVEERTSPRNQATR